MAGRATDSVLGWGRSVFVCLLALMLASTDANGEDLESVTPSGAAQTEARLGEALRDLGRDEEAIDAFRRALALAPDDAGVHLSLGSLLATEGQPEAALAHLDRAVSLASNASAHYELAQALRMLNRWDEALAHYEAAIDLDPHNENARVAEAEALLALGRFDETLHKLEAALVEFPNSRGIKFGLAWVAAACPDVRLRDGARGLELAQGLFTERRSLAAAELIAAARAELGRCDEAAQMQRFVVHQAVSLERPVEVVARLERALEWFESDMVPCGVPKNRPTSERPHWPRAHQEAGFQSAG